MNQTVWLVQRSILAIVLMVGFYVLALAMAAAFIGVFYVQVAYGNEVSIRLAVASVFCGVAILLSIVPRRDRFVAPGPLIDEAAEPRVFAFVREIAAAMGERMPDEIYMISEANAWVAQRGGFIGFGSRRVMALGLPLLQALPVPELRAVLAHEFGHYASNDVKLGPWIYKTRKAIAQTLQGLEDSWFSAPFEWYSGIFLRLTYAISRRQEFVADQAAARVVGPDVLTSALRRVNAVAPAYHLYFERDVAPVLRAGFLPPVADGFNRFLRSALVQTFSSVVIAAAENKVKAEQHDTHPPLRDRVAALGGSDAAGGPQEMSETASVLLRDADACTRVLMTQAIGEERMDALNPIAWREVVTTVFVAQWRASTLRSAPVLARLTFDTCPAGRAAFMELATLLKVKGLGDQRVGYTARVFGAAVAVRMLDEGWQPEMLPGEPLMLTRDGARFEPFTLTQGLADGTVTVDEWMRQCGSAGLTGRLCVSDEGPAPETMNLNAPPPAPKAARRRRQW